MVDSALEIARMSRATDFDIRSLGRIGMDEDGDLAIFNYTPECSFAPMATWNRYEKVCRGLIVNRKLGTIVARPFKKFYHLSEDLPEPGDELISVTEKMDGSLGLLMRTPAGDWRISTRGAFHSPQAEWATDFFLRKWSNAVFTALAKLDLTFLFEIIVPFNKIVVDYSDREDLVLLGIMGRRVDHDYCDVFVDGIAQTFGFSRPQRYDMWNIDEIVAAAKALDANHEGWVLRYASGKRLKVKGDAYRMMHKMIQDVSFRHAIEAIQAGRLAEVVDALPVDYAKQMRQWGIEIETGIAEIQASIFADVEAWRVKDVSRKEFALWVMAERKPLAELLFTAMDSKDTRSVILKRFAEKKQARW